MGGVMRRAACVVLGVLLCSAPLAARQGSRQATKPDPRVPNFDWGPYDVKELGIGSRSTAFIVLGDEDCKECVASMDFYKSLMGLKDMDGKKRRVVVVAAAGVWPVKTVTDAHGFKPHRLNSGPYPRRPVPGVTKWPTILVVDGKGVERGRWAGVLSAAQQKTVVAALMK